jgi:hypothetical protein
MDGPIRKSVAPAEATQELQALDVLEVVATAKAKAAEQRAARGPFKSSSSIAPVGLDLVGKDDGADEELVMPTGGIVLPPSRRRLRGIVIGAVAFCALILAAAGIARVGHASSEPAGHDTVSASAPVTAATSTPAATAGQQPAATTTGAAPASHAPTSTAGQTAGGTDRPSTGTVHLTRPAKPGRVWLDGKKITSTSAMVSCGTHQLKVGYGRTHSIDVPCGGEIAVSK